MAKFSEIFSLVDTQAELDFVDIDLDTDTPLYICPYAIQIRADEWSAACGDNIRSFFNALLDALRANDLTRAIHLLSHLHEPNETFLGESEGRPSGRGVGNNKATDLVEAMVTSRAFETGVLADISEAELFIYGVGRDTISDLTTNILRGLLARYTVAQCEIYGIPTHPVGGLGPVWDTERLDWVSMYLDLPTHEDRPILLVPKYSVRQRLSLNSREFYDHFMVEYLREEYRQSTSALVRTLKDGTRKVTKKSVKERHPFAKNNLAAFVAEHPDILESYKNSARIRGPLEQCDLEEGFDERAFATALIERLQLIPPGSERATHYHKLAAGICTFLFYPHLITPVKEFEQHEGRKRVDIKFTNAAESGFFFTMLSAPQTRAISVLMECKNYTQEVRNQELDQLSGRFGVQRGFFGFLLCRNMENRQRIINGCRDTANDGRGYMIVFEDADLIEMLTFVEQGDRPLIDPYLTRRYDEVSN